MKYIDNVELREWVKDSLKMTIFQKAHALAIQTGCQILVKLQDDTDITQQQQYYATSRLKKMYRQTGLREQPGEECVSGVTGLPLVEQGIQSEQEHVQIFHGVSDIGQRSASENGVTSQGSGPDERLDSGEATEGPSVHMQVGMSSDTISQENREPGDEETDLKPKTETLDATDKAVRIKLEPIDVEEDPGGGGGDTDAPMYQEQMHYDDNSIQTPMSTETPHKATQQLLQATSLFHQQQQQQQRHIPPSPATILHQHQEQYQQQQVPMSPKPYQCAMCGKAFRSVQVLQKHTQTFHMRSQQHHVVAIGGRNRGRGRGRQTWQRLIPHAANPPQTNSFQCVMCNITFPDSEILQDHMTRIHMGGATSSIPQESSDDHAFTTPGEPPSFSSSSSVPGDPSSIPGTSQQSTSSFPIPHTQSAPSDMVPSTALQHIVPYNIPSTSSAPYSKAASSSSPGKPGTSDGGTFPRSPMRSKFSSHCYKGTSIQAIMAAILLSAGPVSNYRSFIDGGPKHLRKITKETFDEAAQELHKASMGQFIAMLGPTAGLKEVFVKKAPNEECKILLEQTTLCSMVEYMSRYQQPPPRRIARIYLEQLVEMGFLLPEQIRRQPSYSAVKVS